jgi:hypothetical protein
VSDRDVTRAGKKGGFIERAAFRRPVPDEDALLPARYRRVKDKKQERRGGEADAAVVFVVPLSGAPDVFGEFLRRRCRATFIEEPADRWSEPYFASR